MSVLHTAYVEAVREIRRRLGEANCNSFSFAIKAEGRCETGEDSIKVEYHLYNDYSETVVGDTVDAVVEEVLRRKGWKQAHKPLRLA